MPRSSSPAADNNLPFIDEHQVVVATCAATVWHCLTTQITRPPVGNGKVLAHALAAEPRRGSGTPLGVGATLPGFSVAEAVPGLRIRLTGRHRFSRYALTFTLAEQPYGTLLSARTDAAFPGPRGRVYRALVIGSGAHRVLVVRLLREVRRRAERLGRDAAGPSC